MWYLDTHADVLAQVGNASPGEGASPARPYTREHCKATTAALEFYLLDSRAALIKALTGMMMIATISASSVQKRMGSLITSPPFLYAFLAGHLRSASVTKSAEPTSEPLTARRADC